MKYWKRMKKSTKVGLAGSLAYASLSFITPVLADNQAKAFDIKAIETVEQAEQAYNTQLEKAVEDKKINYQEAETLAGVLNKLSALLEGKSSSLKEKIWKLERPDDLTVEEKKVENKIYLLRATEDPTSTDRQNIEDEIHELNQEEKTPVSIEIQAVKDSIKELHSKRVYTSPEFEKIKEDFDKDVLCYFPLLLEKPLFYSASDPIENKLNPVMKDIVLKADEFLKKYYNDSRLELLGEKEAYTVKDLLTFYHYVHKERSSVCFNLEELKQERLELEAKLKPLEVEEGKYIQNRGLKISSLREKLGALEEEWLKHIEETGLKVKALEGELKVLEQKRLKWVADNNLKIDALKKEQLDVAKKFWELKEERDVFKRYLGRKDDIDHFIMVYGDLNKYMSLSLFAVEDGFLKKAYVDKARKEFKYENKLEVSRLEDHFKSKGYDVKVASLKNPAHTMLPWPWWVNAIFGGMFPIARNALAAGFIRREFDVFDGVEGIFEGIFCPILFDACFPLFYPLRLFATPFLVEPIRAATGWRDLKWN